MVASCPSQEPPYSPRLARCSPSRGRHSLQQGLPCLLWTAWWSASWHCVATASSPLVSASKLGAKQDVMGAAAVLPPGTPSQLGAEHGEVGGGDRQLPDSCIPEKDARARTSSESWWSWRSPLPYNPQDPLAESGLPKFPSPLHPLEFPRRAGDLGGAHSLAPSRIPTPATA